MPDAAQFTLALFDSTGLGCQSARKRDPYRRARGTQVERLVPVVHRGDPRAAECPTRGRRSGARGVPVDPPVQVAMDPVSVQARFLKRQLSFPVSTMSQ
jgi:hypothetical protein